MGIVPENDDDLKSSVLKYLATTETLEPENPVADKQYHTVGTNETLYSIGRRYGVTVGKIRRLNHLGSSSVIHPGQKLLIEN
jgi:LysM repeat protein